MAGNQEVGSCPVTREFTYPAGTTIGEFFSQQYAGHDPKNYLIRINKQKVPSHYVLTEGTKIVIIPTYAERESTATVSTSGCVSFDPYEWENNNVDPALLKLEEKVKKLME